MDLLSRTAHGDIDLIGYSSAGMRQLLQTGGVCRRLSADRFIDATTPFKIFRWTVLLMHEYEITYSRPVICSPPLSILLALSRYIRGRSEQLGGGPSQPLAGSRVQ